MISAHKSGFHDFRNSSGSFAIDTVSLRPFKGEGIDAPTVASNDRREDILGVKAIEG